MKKIVKILIGVAVVGVIAAGVIGYDIHRNAVSQRTWEAVKAAYEHQVEETTSLNVNFVEDVK